MSVVPDGNQLDLCAFYAMQLVLEKAYGNYLGLVRLGEFLAHEMTLELRRVTCVASVTKLSQAPGFTKKRREALAKSIREAVGSATA